jgi:hypothetical protein
VKILNKEQFKKVPPRTLWAFCRPHYMEGLHIKAESQPFSNEWFWDIGLIEPISIDHENGSLEPWDDMMNGGSAPAVYDEMERESIWEHDDDQLYVVYEDDDIIRLIAALQECIKGDNNETVAD